MPLPPTGTPAVPPAAPVHNQSMTTQGGGRTFRRRMRVIRLVFTRSITEFLRDRGPDMAGSLTYYGVLSLFPALLVVISLLGVFGQGARTVDAVMDLLSDVAPAEILDPVRGPIESLVTTPTAGLALVVGVVVALWSSSRYVWALGRAMNQVFEVEEGRPLWRVLPAGLGLTAMLIVLVAVGGLALVFTGPVAAMVGGWIGLGRTAVAVWEVAMWPAVLVTATLALALLYRFAPNVSGRRFRWISLGAAAALAIIAVATAGFSFFVLNFSNFNEVYGSLAGVIVFLLWLWLVNIAVVYGARLDAEVIRVRQLRAGIQAAETIRVTPRDTRAEVARERRRAKMLAEYRGLLREPAVPEGAGSAAAGAGEAAQGEETTAPGAETTAAGDAGPGDEKPASGDAGPGRGGGEAGTQR